MKRAAEAGETLDLSRRGDNTLRAAAIRDLLRSGDVDPRGLRVRGARITGELDLDNMRIPTYLGLDACQFEEPLTLIDTDIHSLSLEESTVPSLEAGGLRARFLGMRYARAGAVVLDDANIDGTLAFSFSSLRSLRGLGLKVSRNLMAQELYIRDSDIGAPMWLSDCEIGGHLHLADAVIVNDSDGAMLITGAKIRGSVYLGGSFVKAGGAGSAVHLIDINATALWMDGAVVRSAQGTAVCLDGSQFQAEVRLDKGFDARSSSTDSGTVRLVNTRIGASLIVQGTVRNDDGPAVVVWKSETSAILDVEDTVITATNSGPALEIGDTAVGGSLIVRPEKLINDGRGYELSLSNTKVRDTLRLDVPALLESESFAVTVNGLTYPEPPADTDAWLTMLRERNFKYEPQPYQQLAAVHRAAGHDHTARKVLIAQQRDLRRRGDPGNKLWHWFLGATLGYGYKPSRAVAGLLATFVLALCLVWTTNAYNGLTPAKDRGPDACSPVNRISLAADLAIPLVKLGGTPRCELANGPAGQWATGAGWVVQILGWSFATLSVAGFTGLVRKS